MLYRVEWIWNALTGEGCSEGGCGEDVLIPYHFVVVTVSLSFRRHLQFCL